MAYGDFTLTRDKAPCHNCAHGAGGCQVRQVCQKWEDWEKRKALRYADVRRVRAVQVEQFGIGREMYRRALANKATGR